MNVLLLSPYSDRLAPIFAAGGDTFMVMTDPVAPETLEGMEFVVSFGYRHIIRRPVLDRLPGRIINLHTSYLPFNRGADPNLWSWIDDTPKGVTIHLVDEGLDTGAILAQRITAFPPGQTLASSYTRLQDDMVALFAASWPAIRSGAMPPKPQQGSPTTHRSRDKDSLFPLLPAGWDTPVEVAARLARATRAARA